MSLSKREKRVIAEISADSRQKQSDIASRMRVSPQTLKYHLDSLRERGVFNEVVVLDPARFGLITIRVFLSFTSFRDHAREVVIDALHEEESVVFVQRLRLGADLLVEYAVPNLSLFNKIHTSFLDKYSNFVKNKHVFPVLVRYDFQRSYLHPKLKHDSNILSGDRDVADISNADRAVLSYLRSEPGASVAQISRGCDLDPRTVRKTLRECIDDRIIRSFSVDINYELASISSAYLGIEFSHVTPQEMKRFVTFVREVDEVVGLTKVIGHTNVFVHIESFSDYTSIIEKLRAAFEFTEYSVFSASNILKNTYIPASELEFVS